MHAPRRPRACANGERRACHTARMAFGGRSAPLLRGIASSARCGIVRAPREIRGGFPLVTRSM
jgi:hypothetical protein